MKHLIPYLQDDQKAADYLRQLRWPNGITCPRCGSDVVEPRERCDNGLQRFNCVHCAVRLGQQCAMVTDWTSAIFEESQLRPLEWLLVMGLWQLKLTATAIAAAADIQERTAQRCIHWLDGGIYETYHLGPTRQLEHQVEADECSQSAGSQGLARAVARRERAPRPRGIQLRGRATAELGRPPLLGLVQRRDKTDQDAPAAQVYLEVLENVRTATIKPIIAAKVKSGRSSSPMNTASPSPVMRPATGLHTDEHWGQCSDEGHHGMAGEAFAQDDLAPLIHSDNVKEPLCDVNSEYANMFHRPRLLWLNGFTGHEIILAH